MNKLRLGRARRAVSSGVLVVPWCFALACATSMEDGQPRELEGRVQALGDNGGGPSSDDDCEEGIDASGNETICVEGSTPTDPCTDQHGPGWETSTDPFGTPTGCVCTGDPFLCGGGGGGGSGGGDPPPPGGGGGGGGGGDGDGDDDPEDPDPARDLKQCLTDCFYGNFHGVLRGCISGGYNPDDTGVPCLYPSEQDPNRCAGVDELCLDLNVLPNGEAARPWRCELPQPPQMAYECSRLLTECQQMWLHWHPTDGDVTLLGQCENVADDAVDDCSEVCPFEQGLGCTATDRESGDKVSGTLNEQGMCCDVSACSNCAVQSHIECEFQNRPARSWPRIDVALATVPARASVDATLEVRGKLATRKVGSARVREE